jgi:hypothetical protein
LIFVFSRHITNQFKGKGTEHKESTFRVTQLRDKPLIEMEGQNHSELTSKEELFPNKLLFAVFEEVIMAEHYTALHVSK